MVVLCIMRVPDFGNLPISNLFSVLLNTFHEFQIMQISGNILLLLSLLAAGFLFKLTFLQKMPGGDASVGYAWSLLFLMAVFWGCIILVACILGFGGGFAWLSLGRFAGGGMLVLCFLIMLFGANLGMDPSFKGIRFLAPVNAVATSVVLMATFAVLLNENLKMSVSPILVKRGLAVVLALNSLMLATMIFWAITSRVNTFLSRFSDKLSDFELGILDKIDRCDASKDITSLFLYSGDNQPRQIREKAVLKIKSKPDWQDDLFHTLEGDGVQEAFQFLLSNDVDDKPRFAKGVYQGVLSQARLIREGLRRCWHQSQVKDGQFGFELRRTLKAVEKFKDLGVDFKPAVKELRAALDERIAYDNPNVSDKKTIDKWLEKH